MRRYGPTCFHVQCCARFHNSVHLEIARGQFRNREIALPSRDWPGTVTRRRRKNRRQTIVTPRFKHFRESLYTRRPCIQAGHCIHSGRVYNIKNYIHGGRVCNL